MSDRIKKLYHSHILVNAKDESHQGELAQYSHDLEAYNPMCGDQYNLQLQIENDKVLAIRFKGNGCSISKASTAVLCKTVEGQTIDEVKKTVQMFLELVNDQSEKKPENLTDNKDLLAFAVARDFPERKTCADLVWTSIGQKLDYFKTLP